MEKSAGRAAHNLLSDSDWYVTRKSEKDIAIPAGITSYRDSVRTICESRKVSIAGASDVDALVGIVTFHNLDWYQSNLLDSLVLMHYNILYH